MPFALTIRGPVLCVRWRGFTPEDLKPVAQHVVDLRRSSGLGVVYVSRIPADNRVFSREETAALLDYLLRLLPHCVSIHHVIDGHGFIKSARQSIVTNMALATPRPRAFYTHSTMREAFEEIRETHGYDLLDVLRESTSPSAFVPKSSTRLKSEPPVSARSWRAGAEFTTKARRK